MAKNSTLSYLMELFHLMRGKIKHSNKYFLNLR